MPVHPNSEPLLKATNAGMDAMVQLSGFEWLIVCALIAVLLALAAAGCMVRLPELLDEVIAMLKVNQGSSVAPNA